MSNVTIHLDVEERYPEVLLIDKPGGYYSATTEADAEQVERWRRAIAEFNAVQDEMAEAYRKAGGKG